MAIRSVEEYKQSLRDGRRVYIRGGNHSLG